MNEPSGTDVSTVHLFCALVIQGAIQTRIASALQAASGLRLVSSFDPTSVLMKRIGAGERADLIVAIDEDIDRLTEAGIVSRIGRTPLVATDVAVAVRAGQPKPDIGDVAQLKAALLAARSVAYSRTGASGIYFARLIAQLGIADAVDARATVITSGLVAQALTDGRADLAIQQRSELLTVEGVAVVGGLPEAVAHRTSFSAAAFLRSVDLDKVQHTLAFLASDGAGEVYRSYGLSLPGRPS